MQADTSNVAKGTVIVPDGDFTCMDAGNRLTVEQDDGGLFVPCDEGKHYLDGQLDQGTVYVGFSVADEAQAA